MSDVKVEEAKPAVEEVKAVEEVAPAVPAKTEESTSEGPAAEAVEEKKEEEVALEVKEDPKPISEGFLEFKPPGILHMLIPSKRFFYLQEEPIAIDNLASYLKKEKSDTAHSNAAHATVTGKGLLFFSKSAEHKNAPSGIIKLSTVTDVTPSGNHKFTLKFSTGDFHFEGAERDSWVHTLKEKVASAKESVESVVTSEEYKAALEKLAKPAPKPVVAVKETAADKGKEKAEETKEVAEEEKEEAKEEAKEVKEEAKEEKEEIKEEAKEEKKEKKEKKDKKEKKAKKEEKKDDDSSSSSSSEDEEEKKEEKKKAEASKKASKRTSFLAPFFSKDKKEKDTKEKVAEVKEEEAKKEEPETIKEEPATEAAVVAPAEAAPEAEKTEEAKLEAPVEEAKAESATSGKAAKRQSFFGLGGFLKEKSHAEKKPEKVEEEKTEEPAKEGEAPVEKSAEAVAVPATETTESRPQVASPKDSFMKLFHKKKEAEAKGEVKAEEAAAVPAETTPAAEEAKAEEAVVAPAETAAPAAESSEAVPSPGKEKRRSSFFGNFGKKKEGVTSDSETEEAKSPSSPLPKKLSGFLNRSKSKSGKSTEAKDTTPEAVPEVPEIETVTTTETPVVATEDGVLTEPVVATETAPAVEATVPKPVQATA